MKIFIFGNIASGKSTVLKRIWKNHRNFAVVQIDTFRESIGCGTVRKETIARNAFIRAIDKGNSNQIIECTGIGIAGQMLLSIIPKIQDKVLIIILIGDPSICWERALLRGADNLNGNRETIREMIFHDSEFRELKNRYRMFRNVRVITVDVASIVAKCDLSNWCNNVERFEING